MPDFQDLHDDAIPVRREPGVIVRIYSGESGGLRAAARNHVPVTIVEARLEPGASFTQELPSTYNGFVFPIEGRPIVGDDHRDVRVGEVGWLDRPSDGGVSRLTISAGTEPARVILYAGEPQGDPIVAHGPFIGDSREDIARLYTEFHQGGFVRMSELARARKTAVLPSAR